MPLFNITNLTATDVLNEATKSKLDKESILSKIKDKKISPIDVSGFVRHIYRIPGESIAAELPSICGIIRKILVIGGPAIVHPVLGIFAYIADKTIEDSVNAKTINGYIMQYTNQLKKAEDLMYENPSNKAYKAHVQDLEKGLDKLKTEANRLKVDYKTSGITKKVKDIDISEACSILECELDILCESQLDMLISDDEILSEGTKLNKAKMATKSAVQSVSRKQEAMDRWFNDTLKSIKGSKSNATREEIVENSYPKLSKMVRRAIMIGASWAINPALAAITVMVTFAKDKNSRRFERQKLMNELNRELELCEEKIRDADGAGDRKKKYELIRLKHKLTTEKERIKKLLVFDKKRGDTKRIDH